MEVLSGVPQGSVLGPLLFLIYINSLGDNLESNWFAFADDFKLCCSVTGGSGCLQRDLDRIQSISESWNLKINTDKRVVVGFGGARSSVGGESGYFLGGIELRVVGEQRDLGVLVDKSLKFHSHIDGIVRRASTLSRKLLRSIVCRENNFMKILFISHIRPTSNIVLLFGI